MKTLKALVALMMAMALVFCLCACGGDDNTNTEPQGSTSGNESTEASKETENTEPEDTFSGYTVKVVDEAGNPISGAVVQLCLEACVPGFTNEEGIATFDLPEEDYKVSFVTLPAGYTYATEEDAFYFADGSKEMTITLKAAEAAA